MSPWPSIRTRSSFKEPGGIGLRSQGLGRQFGQAEAKVQAQPLQDQGEQ
jgi:hypothetical protein